MAAPRRACARVYPERQAQTPVKVQGWDPDCHRGPDRPTIGHAYETTHDRRHRAGDRRGVACRRAPRATSTRVPRPPSTARCPRRISWDAGARSAQHAAQDHPQRHRRPRPYDPTHLRRAMQSLQQRCRGLRRPRPRWRRRGRDRAACGPGRAVLLRAGDLRLPARGRFVSRVFARVPVGFPASRISIATPAPRSSPPTPASTVGPSRSSTTRERMPRPSSTMSPAGSRSRSARTRSSPSGIFAVVKHYDRRLDPDLSQRVRRRRIPARRWVRRAEGARQADQARHRRYAEAGRGLQGTAAAAARPVRLPLSSNRRPRWDALGGSPSAHALPTRIESPGTKRPPRDRD